MKTPLTASCTTDCQQEPLLFQDLGSRKVVADFSGGMLSSDGGVLLVRKVDAGLGLTASLAQCFRDGRQAIYVDHSGQQLVAQRIYRLVLGYEDFNDHEWLRLDPLLATACDKLDPTGQDRFNPAHRGIALAGASTLNRLELSNNRPTRAHKLAHDPGQVGRLSVANGGPLSAQARRGDRVGSGCDGTSVIRAAGGAALPRPL